MAAPAVLAGICLALAGAPLAAPQFVPTQAFTLAWAHSIEKTRWEEDYRIQLAPDGQPELWAGEARIRGSGAGMDPPEGARLEDGWYVYQPASRPAVPLRLTRSPYTPDYDWCENGICRPLSDLLASDGGITLLYPCRAGPSSF